MNKMSLKGKTFLLSGVIMFLILSVGAGGIYATKNLGESIKIVSQQALPAVRNMTLVDMMHDGLRAVVYRGFVSTQDERKDVKAEFEEFSQNITSYLKEIEKLNLNNELNEAIKKTEAKIKIYQDEGRKILELVFDDRADEAKANLPLFIKSFDLLAEDLESLGEKIQTLANLQAEESRQDAEVFSYLSLGMMVFGVMAAGFISYLAYSFISGLTLGLLNITHGIENETQMIVETSQSMSEVAGKLSEASTEQAASLQETVTSIDEISAMVSRNADSAKASAQMSDQSTQVAHRVKETAEEMLGSIHAIARGNDEIIHQMQKSNLEISEIVKMIQNISHKTQVINDIVFQTKLLSFNASVEAARAGEHGKGFAVVAEEVGNLASMSGKAATEITEMLTQSVKKVTDIVDGTKGLMENLIRQSKEKVDLGTTNAKQCVQSIEEILANVSSVNEMVREIATASKEQSAGVNEVNKAMSELDKVTQSNSSVAQESAKAAHGLESQAERLNSLVAELTLIVGGKESKKKTESGTTPPSNVLKYTKPEKVKVKLDQSEKKKVVGIDFDIPQGNDPRFEDA
jgi:methyl-accepting chemotaxis protein